jgi:hypothetical protein
MMPQKLGTQKLGLKNNNVESDIEKFRKKQNIKKAETELNEAQNTYNQELESYQSSIYNINSEENPTTDENIVKEESEYDNAYLELAREAEEYKQTLTKYGYVSSVPDIEKSMVSNKEYLGKVKGYQNSYKGYSKERQEYLNELESLEMQNNALKEGSEYLTASTKLAESIVALNPDDSEVLVKLDEEKKYFKDEENRISVFNQSLISTPLESGDFVEQQENFMNFAESNKDLIENSSRNYKLYENMLNSFSSTDRYVQKYLTNPEYDIINQGDTTIIRKKPISFVTEEEWSKGDKTKRKYETYNAHELVLKNGKLASEIYRDTTMLERNSDREYKFVDYGSYITKNLQFQDNKISKKDEFKYFKEVDESGGGSIYRLYSPFQSKSVDYNKKEGWSMSQPRTEFVRFKVNDRTNLKPSGFDSMGEPIFITPSNLFGNAKNKLKKSEFELSNLKVISNTTSYNLPQKTKETLKQYNPKQQILVQRRTQQDALFLTTKVPYKKSIQENLMINFKQGKLTKKEYNEAVKNTKKFKF